MAPRGGYKKNTDPRGEYVRLDQVQDAEAKLCAAKMGQTLEVWIHDAVAHHLYRSERTLGLERYREDELRAAAERKPTPDPYDLKYHPDREQPITSERRGPVGQGGGPATGRGYTPN